VEGALKSTGDRGRPWGGVLSLCLEWQINEEKNNNKNNGNCHELPYSSYELVILVKDYLVEA
jgi:hypothetical protein